MMAAIFILIVWNSIGTGIFLTEWVMGDTVTFRRMCWRILCCGPLVWIVGTFVLLHRMIRESDAWRQFNDWLDAK